MGEVPIVARARLTTASISRDLMDKLRIRAIKRKSTSYTAYLEECLLLAWKVQDAEMDITK